MGDQFTQRDEDLALARKAASELQRLRGEVERLTMTLEAEEAGQLVAVDFIDKEHADEVQRLRGEVERLTATIDSLLSDIKGGIVLDRRVFGQRCWNVLDLERV